MPSRSVLVLVLAAIANILAQSNQQATVATPIKTNNIGGPLSTYSFDYIVVGSGPGGATVADRLSEKTNNAYKKVLLVEAGGNPLDFVDDGIRKGGAKLSAADIVLTPINWDITVQTPIDWKYVNYGEVNQMPLATRYQAAGKALGGTTTINTMMYVRGNQYDYDNWEDNYKADGWEWSDVLPYFRKAENSTRYSPNNNIHGNKGPINIGPSGFQPAADYAIVDTNKRVAAANGRTITFTADWNDGLNTNVVGFHEHTINNQTGERVTAMAHITPYIDPSKPAFRNNLFVSSRSFVTKVNFNNANPPKAISVTFTDYRNNQVYTATASKEIIISAGAIRSPQLLLLSGVGPAAQLASFGINLVSNVSGVGENIQDHPVINIDWTTSLDTPAEFGSVGYTQSLGARCNTFFKTSGRPANDPRPDMQIIWLPPTFGYMLGFMYNLHPYARGRLTLATADPTDQPNVLFNYFNDPQGKDLAAMVEGVIAIMKVAQHPNTQLGEFITVPRDAAGQPSMNATIVQNFILANYGSGYHYVGSCKMGKFASDPMAVVNSKLQVRGTAGLRVCDASIMPELTSGNTQAPTYMIGEKCADLVKADN